MIFSGKFFQDGPPSMKGLSPPGNLSWLSRYLPVTVTFPLLAFCFIFNFSGEAKVLKGRINGKKSIGNPSVNVRGAISN